MSNVLLARHPVPFISVSNCLIFHWRLIPSALSHEILENPRKAEHRVGPRSIDPSKDFVTQSQGIFQGSLGPGFCWNTGKEKLSFH